MAIEVTMPRLSDTMETGKVLKWLKRVGDTVTKGEVIAEIETDKANMEMEAYDSGVLTRIVVPEGGAAPIGETIAVIGDRADVASAAAAPDSSGAASVAATSPVTPHVPPAGEPPEPAPPSATPTPTGRVKASPLARRVAEERGVDLRLVTGTGPGGRIVRADVEAVAAAPKPPVVTETVAPIAPAPSRMPAAPETPTPSVIAPPPPAAPSPVEGDTVVPLSRMQQTIAKRMLASKQSVPHFYVTIEVDATELAALRKAMNSAGEAVSISYNDFVIRAVAMSLVDMPLLNATYHGETMVHHAQVHIGSAVSVPNGLLVPVLRDVHVKGVRQIATEMKALIQRTRENRLRADDISGATFTISNLGMFDVDEFMAIVDPPAVAILAVGTIQPKPVVVDGAVVIRERLRLTLSCDHRVVYGAEAAQFLQLVKRRLEHPFSLLG